jgi:mannitol/fructose-specific phosphotransferase system IIA component (Ntr-type)
MDGQTLNLGNLLLSGGSWHNIPGHDPGSFITAALAAMSEPGWPDRRSLAATMLAREATAATAVGGGIAFPHTLADHEASDLEPFVAVAYPRFRVPWSAPDGLPVYAAFLIWCTDRHDHLRILSSLARLCANPAFRSALADEADIQRLAGFMGPAGTIGSDPSAIL